MRMISRRGSIGIDEKAYSYKQRCAERGTDTYSGVGWQGAK